MKARKSFISVVLLLLASTAACVGLSAEAGAFEWTVHEFNTENSAQSAQLTVWNMVARQPWFASQDEVCNMSGVNGSMPDDMADYIETNISSVGYSVSVQNYFEMTSSSTACDDPRPGFPNGALGVLAYTRGPGIPSHILNYAVNPAPYNYGAICVESSTYLGNIVACGTHLYFGGGSTAQNQATDLRTQVGSIYPGMLKVLLGDFNLRPPGGINPIPSGYYSNYFEVDQYYNNPTRDSGLKNDFIFGAANAFNGYGNVSIEPTPYSDHHYFTGSLFS